MKNNSFKWEVIVSLITVIVMLGGILAYQVRVNTQVENLASDVSEIKSEVQGLGAVRIAIASLKERVASLEETVFHRRPQRNEE